MEQRTIEQKIPFIKRRERFSKPRRTIGSFVRKKEHQAVLAARCDIQYRTTHVDIETPKLLSSKECALFNIKSVYLKGSTPIYCQAL